MKTPAWQTEIKEEVHFFTPYVYGELKPGAILTRGLFSETVLLWRPENKEQSQLREPGNTSP
jgi:hypothetical protein